MASDTAPAAVPDPADPTNTATPSGPATGSLTSLLAPVEPARPTSAAFNLDPANATPDTAAQEQTAGVSSAAYQDDANTPQNGDKNSTGNRQQTGVIRAWLLAGAERWKKGADARNKRLDIQKAKAQAHQVKESRTVNRSEKIVGGATNSGTTSGKSLDSKAKKSAGGTANGRKNGTSRNGSAGGSGGGGRGTGNTQQASDKTTSSGSTGGDGSKTGASGKSGAGGNTGATGKDGKSGKGSTTETATCGDASGIGLSKDKKSKDHGKSSAAEKAGRASSGATGGSSKDSSAGKSGKGNGGSSTKKSGTSDTTSGTDSKKTDLEKKNTTTGKDGNAASKNGKPKDGTDGGKDSASNQATVNGKPVNTQPSREAGYRDGSRTATVTAHVQAYRDGFKDGHRDTSEAAQREKQRLDKAHAARQQQRAKDQPVTASSADHQPQGPHPVEVKEVTDKHVTLDGGQIYTRGEIRNLKQYERRMGEKATNMDKAAEGTKTLQAHAEEQADKALKFLEMAKTIEGGDRFIGVLNRLHESATIQSREAKELHKRVVRAAENTRVVLTNVETRYGGIYKAVCESPLTKPAELDWYRK